MEEVKSCKTPLEDLRNSALAEYELASSAIHSWNSFIVNAIKNYDPARTEQKLETTEEYRKGYMAALAYCKDCPALQNKYPDDKQKGGK